MRSTTTIRLAAATLLAVSAAGRSGRAEETADTLLKKSRDVLAQLEGEIEVSHTAFLYAVDSAGRVVLQWPFGTSSDDMKDDIEYLFEQGA